MRYLIIILALLITTPVYATNFVRNEVTYHTNKSSKIKDKIRTLVHINGEHKKVKLNKDLTGWEIDNA